MKILRNESDDKIRNESDEKIRGKKMSRKNVGYEEGRYGA